MSKSSFFQKYSDTSFYVHEQSSDFEKPQKDCITEIIRIIDEFEDTSDRRLCLETWNITQKIFHSHFYVVGSPSQQTVTRRNKLLDEILLFAKKYNRETIYYKKRSHFFARHILDVLLHDSVEALKEPDFLTQNAEEDTPKTLIFSTTILFLSGKLESLIAPDRRILDLIFYIPAFAYCAKQDGWTESEILDYLLNQDDLYNLLDEDL